MHAQCCLVFTLLFLFVLCTLAELVDLAEPSPNEDDEDWDLEFGVADEIKGHQVCLVS